MIGVSRRIIFRSLAALATVLLVVAGCSQRPATDTTPQSTVGVVAVNKAIQAHSKYPAVEQLQQEINTLQRQITAIKDQPSPAPGGSLTAAAAASINQAAEQEFTAKMAAKHEALSAQFNERARELRQELEEKLAAYTQEIDKDYHPQIFNLQLKLKTVRLTEEEAKALQGELEKLQNERGAKLAAKQSELAKEMEAALAAEKDRLNQELAAYQQALNAELQQKVAAEKAALASRSLPQTVAPAAGEARAELERQLAAKQQELKALQQAINKDLEDKVAQIAGKRGLTTVLTEVGVNVSAVDITDSVIAEFKK